MFHLQLFFCSIVTNGTALQLCRDTSLLQELHYCSQLHGNEQLNIYFRFICVILRSADFANQAYFNQISPYNLLKQIKSKLCPIAPPSIQGGSHLILKIEISFIVYCCFIISQSEFKFQLQLHGIEQFNISYGFLCQTLFRQFIQNRRIMRKKSHQNILLRNLS